MGNTHRAPATEPFLPRVVVIRSTDDAKSSLAMLSGGAAVVFVLRCGDEDRVRVLDLLVGWSVGSGGSLDRIGPNTVIASPPGVRAVHLARSGVTSVLDEIFHGVDQHLTRDQEEVLIPLATAGSVDAQRRLIDGYAELATVVALWLRPRTMSTAHAASVAHEELDNLVRWPPREGTLLMPLLRRLESALGGGPTL